MSTTAASRGYAGASCDRQLPPNVLRRVSPSRLETVYEAYVEGVLGLGVRCSLDCFVLWTRSSARVGSHHSFVLPAPSFPFSKRPSSHHKTKKCTPPLGTLSFLLHRVESTGYASLELPSPPFPLAYIEQLKEFEKSRGFVPVSWRWRGCSLALPSLPLAPSIDLIPLPPPSSCPSF